MDRQRVFFLVGHRVERSAHAPGGATNEQQCEIYASFWSIACARKALEWNGSRYTQNAVKTLQRQTCENDNSQLLAAVGTFHAMSNVFVTVIDLVNFFEAVERFVFFTHLFVDQAEIVEDLFFRVVHDEDFLGRVLKSSDGKIKHVQVLVATPQKIHGPEPHIGTFSGRLQLGNGVAESTGVNEDFPKLEVE